METKTLESRVERISALLEESKSAKVLGPADFYFAFKQGLVQPYLRDAWYEHRVEEGKVKPVVVSKPFESKGGIQFNSRAERDQYIIDNKSKGFEVLMKDTGLSKARISKILLEFKKKEKKDANQ